MDGHSDIIAITMKYHQRPQARNNGDSVENTEARLCFLNLKPVSLSAAVCVCVSVCVRCFIQLWPALGDVRM